MIILFEVFVTPPHLQSPLHVYFSLKIVPASKFIATLHIYQFQNFVTPPRLFQPPRLLET